MKKKILIIEDEEIMCSLLRGRLANEGYDVRVAKDGEDGLRAMREDKPDLVLLDIIMPKKDGFEVMAEMKNDKNLHNVPIVIISNSGQPVELNKARDLGAKDWLIKTEFDPIDVLEKVKKQIG